MITIGNRKVIFSQTILIPHGEDAWITVPQNGDAVKLHFVFEDTVDQAGKPDPAAKPQLRVRGEEDHAVITLVNWIAPLGGATPPLMIGKIGDGTELWLVVDCTRGPKVSRILIQVMIGGAQ